MTPQLPSNKKFGLLFFGIFFAFALYAYSKNEATLIIGLLLLLSSVFLISSFFYQSLLSPLNKAWFMLGLTLGKIVSPIVLGIIFFGLITPIALIARLLGRDELKLKRPKKSSYWSEPIGSNSDADSFKNQF
jgi:MFS-type transporter involved in bile tolerance (Atg22 family)